MQNRMKTHQLDAEKIESLLLKSMVATLATVNHDGTPYITPIHFVYYEGSVYFHGLPKGQKYENVAVNPSVCLNVYEMDSLLYDAEGRPCETNTKYQSVIITGAVHCVEEYAQKEAALTAIIHKYTPQLDGSAVPENMVKGTAVMKIEISKITGKYYG